MEYGGGFSFTIPGLSVNAIMSTETCCDDQNNKHRRTISTICTSIAFGAAIGGGSGPGSGSISWGGQTKKCKGKVGDSYDIITGFGFNSALVLGSSWSSDNPETTTITTGLGIGVNFGGICTVEVIQDFIVGDCCNEW